MPTAVQRGPRRRRHRPANRSRTPPCAKATAAGRSPNPNGIKGPSALNSWKSPDFAASPRNPATSRAKPARHHRLLDQPRPRAARFSSSPKPSPKASPPPCSTTSSPNCRTPFPPTRRRTTRRRPAITPLARHLRPRRLPPQPPRFPLGAAHRQRHLSHERHRHLARNRVRRDRISLSRRSPAPRPDQDV